MQRRCVPFLFPPGTCKHTNFYWRGGDEYKEKEKIEFDYIQAKNERDKVKKELGDLEKEYEQITQEFK